MAKKWSQKPQGSISTAGMKSMAQASEVTLKQKEAAEEEKKGEFIFVVLLLGQVAKMTKSIDWSDVGVL